MQSRRRLIIAAIVAFVAGLIVLFPARVAYDWFAPPDLGVSGISGSVWSGAATHVKAGNVYVANLKWRFRPFRLITGKLAYAVSTRLGSDTVEADLAFGIGGGFYLTDMPLRILEVSSGVPGLRGSVSARFEQLIIADGMPISAQGTIEVSNLLLPLVSQTSIGGYRADFFTQEDGVVVSVEDTDGVIELAGSLKLTNDRNYSFTGKLAPKSETPPQVRQQMQFLGSANERGQYEFRFEGRL